jgi:predicted P-type ATPase
MAAARQSRRDLLDVTAVPASGRASLLVTAPNEFTEAIPFAFSYLRWVVLLVLSIATCGLVPIACFWFPHLRTHITRLRLPPACIADAHYLLVLVHGDPASWSAVWKEVKVHREKPEKVKKEAPRVEPGADAKKATCRTRVASVFRMCWKKSDGTAKSKKTRQFVWFEFKKHRYSFNYSTSEFERYRAVIADDLPVIQKRVQAGGLTEKEVKERKKLFGENRVDVPKPNILLLLVTKVLHPYYLFQVFSATVWFFQEYTIYAIVILVLSAISMAWEIWSEVSNTNKLRKKMRSDRKVRVLRQCAPDHSAVGSGDKEAAGQLDDQALPSSQAIEINERELVPGDILIVENGVMSADAMILSGACLANESLLTGETRPMTKKPVLVDDLPSSLSEEEPKSKITTAVLQSGSIIAGTKTGTNAVVLSTGFSTMKGELFRSILFPKPITFEFERDSYRYLAVLGAVAIAAFIKRIVDNANLGSNFGDTLINSLDLITIAVPPALPLVLSSGIGFALQRLFLRGIFCIDSQRINSCGQLSCFCFDKTGTLTKDNLEFAGVVPPEQLGGESDGDSSSNSQILTASEIPDSVRWGMACCSGLILTAIEPTPADKSKDAKAKTKTKAKVKEEDPSMTSVKCGQYQGLALDVAMFEASGYDLYHSDDDQPIVREGKPGMVTSADIEIVVEGGHNAQAMGGSNGFTLVDRHAFDADLQRSSVVVASESQSGTRYVWVKGSAEVIGALCVDSPPSLASQVAKLSAKGYYCIALAMREVEDSKETNNMVAKEIASLASSIKKREHVECNLKFQGLALFKNEIKPEAVEMLEEMHKADIDVRVITGDNALTAVHVCRELKMHMKPKVAVVDFDDESGDATYTVVNFSIGPNALQFGADSVTERFDGSNMSRVISECDIAITGTAFQKLRAECTVESMNYLVRKTLIFARVRPQEKSQIVDHLMNLGHVVGMVGDGTNDCGALKTAHVGLALSSAEASIIAPFTSKAKKIKDVPVLIREGRCALTTSFLAFKFMVLYPIIQLAMAATLAHHDLMLTNNQYIWDDLAIVLGLAILMLYTPASTNLTKELPPKTLFAPVIVGSILGQVIIFVGFFAAQLGMLSYESDWFCSISDATLYLSGELGVSANCAVYLDYNSYDNPYSFEDTSIWLFSHLQYFSVAAAFNLDATFRQPVYKNWSFTAFFLAALGVNLWFLLDTSGVIADTFQTMPIPIAYRCKMLGLFLGHFIAAIAWELLATKMLPRCCCFRRKEDSKALARRTSVVQLASE